MTEPLFAFGVGAGLALAALVHAAVWAGYEARDHLAERRARPVYVGRRRAGQRRVSAHGSPRPVPPWVKARR